MNVSFVITKSFLLKIFKILKFVVGWYVDLNNLLLFYLLIFSRIVFNLEQRLPCVLNMSNRKKNYLIRIPNSALRVREAATFRGYLPCYSRLFYVNYVVQSWQKGLPHKRRPSIRMAGLFPGRIGLMVPMAKVNFAESARERGGEEV